MLTLLLLVACTPTPTTTPVDAPPPEVDGDQVAVRVNGAPITEAEVRLVMSAAGGHGGAKGPDAARAAAIDALVRQELRAQEARRRELELALHVARQVESLQAQASTRRRDAWADLLIAQNLQADPDEAALRAWFEAHGDLLRIEVHAQQILVRDRKLAEQALARLRAGEPFAEVAADRFKVVPPGTTPWDLGYLKWSQLPEPWHEAVQRLEPGQVSDILTGQGDRYWIVHVVDKRMREPMSFAQAEDIVRKMLLRERREGSNAALDAELRDKATVEVVPH